MKKLKLTLVALLFAFNLFAQLPQLSYLYDAPCGTRVDWDHSPTGLSDPVGFKLRPDDDCLPDIIVLRHEAYVILDDLETWVLCNGVWVRIQSSGWHSGLYTATVNIPACAQSVIFVSHNNLKDFTAWWLEIDCIYSQDNPCCNIELSFYCPEVLCPGDSLNLVPSVVGGHPPYTFHWGGGIYDSLCSSIVYQTTNYVLEVTDRLGCKTSKLAKVFVPSSPVLPYDTLVCPGSLVTMPNNPKVAWQGPSSSMIEHSTTFHGITIDTFGCEFDVPFFVEVQRTPLVQKDTQVCRGDYVSISSSNAVDYTWTTSNGFLSNKDHVSFVAHADSVFYLQAKDSLGCIWKDTVSVLTSICFDSLNFYIPNVFKFGDQDNGYWGVFLDPAAYDDVSIEWIQIWDRWGSKIWEQFKGEMVWSGYYSDGKPAQSGVYVWRIRVSTLEGEKEFYGDVTLIK